jgi:hypothetical protein
MAISPFFMDCETRTISSSSDCSPQELSMDEMLLQHWQGMFKSLPNLQCSRSGHKGFHRLAESRLRRRAACKTALSYQGPSWEGSL